MKDYKVECKLGRAIFCKQDELIGVIIEQKNPPTKPIYTAYVRWFTMDGEVYHHRLAQTVDFIFDECIPLSKLLLTLYDTKGKIRKFQRNIQGKTSEKGTELLSR